MDVEMESIGDSFESYGCRVNNLSIDDLFGQYQKAGFLYPAKMTKLAPYLSLVKDNWRKARRAGELIQWVAHSTIRRRASGHRYHRGLVQTRDGSLSILGAIDPVNLELWETKLDIVLPAAAKILGSEVEALALKRRFLEFLKRDDSLTYSVAFTVVGQKPPQLL